MNDRKMMILSAVFLAVIVAAAGGRYGWVAYQDSLDEDPQTHFMLAVEAIDTFDPTRLSILLDKYPHLISTHLDTDGTTLLHQAMPNGGDLTLATLLISEGADVNAIDLLGRTPLHALCTDNTKILSPDVVSLLVTSGADINANDHAGETPLHLMALERDVYSEAFPEYIRNISKENRALLINHGAEE